MPIKPENKKLYHPDWKKIRSCIRAQANNACEQCNAPNGAFVIRGEGDDSGAYMLPDSGEVYDADNGKPLGHARGSEWNGRPVKIVLTVAHLDHNPENNKRDNLKALCQRCHFAHDRAANKETAQKTRRAKKAMADLFEELQ